MFASCLVITPDEKCALCRERSVSSSFERARRLVDTHQLPRRVLEAGNEDERLLLLIFVILILVVAAIPP